MAEKIINKQKKNAGFAFELTNDDLYPDVLPWMRDRSAHNWNLKKHTWGSITQQDLDKLLADQAEAKKKRKKN